MLVVCREFYDKEKEYPKYLVFNNTDNEIKVEMHCVKEAEDSILCNKTYSMAGRKNVFLACYLLAGEKELSDLLERKPEIEDEKYVHTYGLSSINQVFGVWIGEEGFTVVSPTYPVLQGNNIQATGPDIKASEMIMLVDDTYRNHFKKIMAKRRLLSNLDANNSLSGLEPQVDIITKIVLRILANNPVLLEEVKKEIPLFDDFVAAYEEGNLLNLKTLESCIEEMRVQKTKIRAEQGEYFKSRG